MTVVFDDDQVVRVGDATNGAGVGVDPGVAHERDGPSVGGDGRFGVVHVDVAGARIDIDEHRSCASKSDRQSGGRELVRRNDHVVARSEIGNDSREFGGIRA